MGGVTWLLTAYKHLLSFRRQEWSLDDYPVRVRRQSTSVETPAVRPWCAQILNWWLVGLGDTPEEAVEDLRQNLEAVRAQRPLPRPGSRPPMWFAASDQIDRHGEFAYEFVERVVGVRPLFMSDEICLADFCNPEEDEGVYRKVALLYGVDTRELLAEPLWKLLDVVRGNMGATYQADAADETQGGNRTAS